MEDNEFHMKVKTACAKMLSIFLVFSLLTACGSKQSSQSGSSQTESSKSDSEPEKVPSDLTDLENNIEMIIKTLNGPAVQVKQEAQQGGKGMESGQSNTSSQESKDTQGNQNSNGIQSSQGNQNSQGSQSSQQGQQQSQPSSSSQQNPMEMIPKLVDKMHYQWNNLMPEAIKKGAKKDLVNNFGTALNNLSGTITSKNKMDIMVATNNLYAYIPDLYSLFKTKPSPEIKRVRYYSRSAILNGLTANWTQADSDITNLKSVWSLYKNSLNKEQQEIANKLDLSIMELEKVVKGKDAQLVNIKGKVELSNTEDLEKAVEGQSGGQSSSQQSGEQSGSQESGGGQSSSQESSGEQTSSE